MAATTQVQILARTFCGIARRFKLHSTFFRFPLRQLLKRVAPHCRLIDAGVRVVYGDGGQAPPEQYVRAPNPQRHMISIAVCCSRRKHRGMYAPTARART